MQTRKSAFVTGANGLLGRQLVAALNAAGYQVTALVRSADKGEGLAAHCEVGDLSSSVALARLVPERVGVFFHVAADVSMWGRRADSQRRTNVEGTRHALAAARAARAGRFVFTSTAGLWGLSHPRFDETSERLGAATRIPYLLQKLEAESLVRKAMAEGLPALILNPGHLVGRSQSGWSELVRTLQEQRVKAMPNGAASWCHVQAVAAAHVAAAERGTLGSNYLLGGPEASYLEFAQTACRLLGVDPPARTAPAWAVLTAAMLADGASRVHGRAPELPFHLAKILCGRLCFSSALAERDLGYHPPSLEALLKDSVAGSVRAPGPR